MERSAILHVEHHDADSTYFAPRWIVLASESGVKRLSDREQALVFLHKSRGIHQKALRPDLVVLDLNMPRVDGWTVRLSPGVTQKVKTLFAVD